jgi:hypothetical protein
MHKDLQKLHVRLVDFGLNPNEWILESTKTFGNLLHLNIRNRKDRELTLTGWALAESWLDLSFQG